MLRTAFANLRAYRLRLLLSSIAIILGVGFVAGTLMMTDSMNRAFYQGFAAGAQNVDAAVTPSSLGNDLRPGATDAPSVPASALTAVRAVPGVAAAEGRVVGQVPLIGSNGKAITNDGQIGFGVSIPSDAALRGFTLTAGTVPTAPDQAVLDRTTADAQHFSVGSTVTVLDPRDVPRTFRVVGLVDFGVDQRFSGSSVVGFDDTEAFAMTDRPGYDEIVARAAGGTSQADLVARISALPQARGDKVETGSALARDLADNVVHFADQFGTVLLIFGLVAVLVSALVIGNTFSILIAQRTRSLALLRCIGATRRQVFGATLLESVLLGLAASVVGLGIGAGLAIGMRDLLQALGANIPSGSLVISSGTVLASLGLGVGVTLVAAVFPARAATRVAPVAALGGQVEARVTGRSGWVRTAIGALLVVAGVGVALVGMNAANAQSGNAQGAFLTITTGGCLALLGVLALGPVIVGPLTALLGWLPGRLFGATARLATANARRNPRRVAATTAALTIGLTLITLFTVVTSSIKASADTSISKHYPFDYGVTAGSDNSGGVAQRKVGAQVLPALQRVPELAVVAPVYLAHADVAGNPAIVGAYGGNAVGSVYKPLIYQGSLSQLVPGTAAVSRAELTAIHGDYGGTIAVDTPNGVRTPRVSVVYEGRNVGTADIILPLSAYQADFAPTGPDQILITAKPGVDPSASLAAVTTAAAADPLATVVSQAQYKQDLNNKIDQLLALFSALLGLAVLIALFGIANTLSLSVIERTRESALLRALGLTRGRLRRMLLLEAMLMALIGVCIGVALGASFGAAVVEGFIRTTSEGVVSIPYLQILAYVAAGALAGVLAAVLPARRAARTSVVSAMADA